MSLPDFAHAQSRTAVFEINSWAAHAKEDLATSLRQIKLGWDGIVLDFSADSSGNPLADLTKSVMPPPLKLEDSKIPHK